MHSCDICMFKSILQSFVFDCDSISKLSALYVIIGLLKIWEICLMKKKLHKSIEHLLLLDCDKTHLSLQPIIVTYQTLLS